MPWLATLHVVAHVRWDGWSISLPLSPIYLIHAILCQKTFHSWTCIIHPRTNSNIISPSLSKYQTFQKSWCVYVGKCMQTKQQYLLDHNPLFRRWNSIVSIMNRLQTGWLGVQIPVVGRDFLLLQNIQTGHETSPPSYSMGMGFILEVQWPEHKTDHSAPSSTKLNVWGCTSVPLLCLQCMDRSNFTFILTKVLILQ